MEERNENSVSVQEPKKSVKVFHSGKKDKPKFFDEEQVYCCLDNHRCDGACRDKNTDASGCLICSEVISSDFLPKKRGRRRKRFFSREDDRDDDSFV